MEQSDQSIVVVFGKQQVKQRKLAHFLKHYGSDVLPEGPELAKLMGTFQFFVEGWDHVPEEVKEDRFRRFMETSQAISEAKLAAKVGQRLEVIVDEVDEEGATCRTNESLEHADFTSLHSKAIDNLKAGRAALAENWYTTPTDFFGIDTAYFAALAAPVTRAPTGQCQQGMAIYDVNTPGAWSIFATYYASAAQTLPAGGNGCRPRWFAAGQPGSSTCEDALTALGLKEGASSKDVESAWSVLRNQPSANVAALDKAREEVIKARQSALRYDFQLYTGPKDQAKLIETAPILGEDLLRGAPCCRRPQTGWPRVVAHSARMGPALVSASPGP